uniref:Sec-Y independent protein translocase component n=1 Tax=Apopellia endiviifolia TaxID=304445 RepID=UPI00257BF42C|nr:Sec-Y independent protein translocase component [Apopellia endiviifolia]WIA66185.1 Sec-Y independent protein translocase component [Apopellia endiviifolia]WIA66226.1 Sec-Y independent protein translocase component [Apopellia endiviifolia]WIA66472.1 Sec-Y independent protein translocase component [Apopellia endiviifolia]WIA66513.1 Sec-Y independent protein translocase component [Apopellia endiviifolia]WIA66554.1 Sec-Y independent protein translocase component [Apopellia endiviifolia]
MNFVSKTISEEVRIRVFRILICSSFTWFTRYWFPEEFIFLLAKPFPTFLPYSDSSLICTQLTEALSTYVTTSLISCFYFLFPLLSYQIWCFSMPSCYEEQRQKYNKLFYLSGFCSFLFFLVTLVWVVPNVWHFSYELSTTNKTNLLIIKSQPKIFDYIMLTVRISFISSICSQVPVLICSLESRGVKTLIKNRRFFMVFPLSVAAFFTPDIWCQIVACLPIYFIIELTIFYASIIRVYKRGSQLKLQ